MAEAATPQTLTRMPTRAVTIMGIIQVFALCTCYLLVATVLRNVERGLHENELSSLQSSNWYRSLNSFRSYFWAVLMVPVILTLVCGRLTSVFRDIALLERSGFWVAVTVTAFALIFSASTTMAAFGGPARSNVSVLRL
jgi:hypothetical protein